MWFTRVGQNIHGKCSSCGRAVNMHAEGWLNDCPEDCPLAIFLSREDEQTWRPKRPSGASTSAPTSFCY